LDGASGFDLRTVELPHDARHLYLQGASRERRRGAFPEDPADANPGPHARAEGKSELHALIADLQTLSEPDRAAVLMRAGERMPYEEIGAALRITPGAAKVKVHRARLKLAELRVARRMR
jgi:RNA polymerase sigma-70 factor (ECF subfamily)